MYSQIFNELYLECATCTIVVDKIRSPKKTFREGAIRCDHSPTLEKTIGLLVAPRFLVFGHHTEVCQNHMSYR